jgi:hypothetical protein
MSYWGIGAAGLLLWLWAAPAPAADAATGPNLAQEGASALQGNKGSERRGSERADR